MVKLSEGNYLKSQELTRGDVVTFLDEGVFVTSKNFFYEDPVTKEKRPKQDFNISVKYKGNQRTATVNATSRKELIKAYGSETAEWVGKKAIIDKSLLPTGKYMILYLPATEAGVAAAQSAPQPAPQATSQEVAWDE